MDLLKLSPLQNVAANSRARLSTDELVGRSVHSLHFVMGGTFTRANVDDITIRAGGKDLLENITGARLETINVYNGRATDAAFFSHYFGNPSANSNLGKHLGDLDLEVYGGNPLEIEVDIGAATNPTLEVWAKVGPPKRAMGFAFNDGQIASVRALVPTLLTPSAAVTKQAQQVGLGSEAGALVRALHLFHSNLTSAEFRKGGDIKFDDVPVAVADYLTDVLGGKVQTSGHYVIDWLAENIEGMAMTTIQENRRPWPMQLRITTSASDSIQTYADLLTAIPLL